MHWHRFSMLSPSIRDDVGCRMRPRLVMLDPILVTAATVGGHSIPAVNDDIGDSPEGKIMGAVCTGRLLSTWSNGERAAPGRLVDSRLEPRQRGHRAIWRCFQPIAPLTGRDASVRGRGDAHSVSALGQRTKPTTPRASSLRCRLTSHFVCRST